MAAETVTETAQEARERLWAERADERVAFARAWARDFRAKLAAQRGPRAAFTRWMSGPVRLLGDDDG